MPLLKQTSSVVVCSQVYNLHKALKLHSLRALVVGITRINLATLITSE